MKEELIKKTINTQRIMIILWSWRSPLNTSAPLDEECDVWSTPLGGDIIIRIDPVSQRNGIYDESNITKDTISNTVQLIISLIETIYKESTESSPAIFVFLHQRHRFNSENTQPITKLLNTHPLRPCVFLFGSGEGPLYARKESPFGLLNADFSGCWGKVGKSSKSDSPVDVCIDINKKVISEKNFNFVWMEFDFNIKKYVYELAELLNRVIIPNMLTPEPQSVVEIKSTSKIYPSVERIINFNNFLNIDNGLTDSLDKKLINEIQEFTNLLIPIGKGNFFEHQELRKLVEKSRSIILLMQTDYVYI